MQQYESFHTKLARQLGLPTPFPERWDNCSAENLDAYIHGVDVAITDPEVTESGVRALLRGIWEHVSTKQKHYFDLFTDYYFRITDESGRLAVFNILEKIGGNSQATLDKFIDIYTTNDVNDTDHIRMYFHSLVARKGYQRHWDAIAQSLTTEAEVIQLRGLANQYKAKLDKRDVTPWLPEVPTP